MAFPLNFTTNSKQALKPERISENSVAFKLLSPITKIVVQPFEITYIDTELSFEMVGMYYGQLQNGTKQTNFFVLGGVIDPGYRGNVIVPLKNLTEKEQCIYYGEEIAHLIFIQVILPNLRNVEEEDDREDIKKLEFYIKYRKTNPSAYVPTRYDESSVGYDLHALKNTCAPPLGTVKVDIGIEFIMEGGPFYGQICNKSGFSTRRNLIVMNGIIDSSYRNSTLVEFRNLSKDTQFIYAGEEIAQMIFILIALPTLVHKEDIDRNTTRGDRGFQSGITGTPCDHLWY